MTRIQRRDPDATYHRLDPAGVTALAPELRLEDAARRVRPSRLHAGECEPSPSSSKRVGHQLDTVPVADWKTWLRWRLLTTRASDLSKPFRDEDFYFRQDRADRRQRAGTALGDAAPTSADADLGEALGQIFVEKYFPPESKRRMQELVHNLRATLGATRSRTPTGSIPNT